MEKDVAAMNMNEQNSSEQGMEKYVQQKALPHTFHFPYAALGNGYQSIASFVDFTES